MTDATVLILGATGYIGGSILVQLVKKHPEFVYTALVRNPKDNEAIEALNVKVAQGSHSKLDLVEKLASESDIVLNCGDADDVPLTEAILKGLRTRSTGGDRTDKRKPILIHTSGAALVAYPPGDSNDRLYDDLKVEDIRNISPDQMHRNVDLKIFEAGDRGSIDTYIVAPSCVFGAGHGPVRNITTSSKVFVQVALQDKQAFQLGSATVVWDSVHLDDLVDLYLLVLEQSLKPIPIQSAYERFYWGSSASFAWDAFAKGIATNLYKRGLLTTDEVKIRSAADFPWFGLLTKNSRTVANRGLKTLGWKPHPGSVIDGLDKEIDMALSQM
ncbi:hypothetical protein FRB96_000702 [Tulasnella sp. 330]|nr:hypothetical protein FRB96_000702 [Tulasnella sp. 330]KAG8882977.1 hypothetical protein FRB97_007464 [Tulasnella sp. 331]